MQYFIQSEKREEKRQVLIWDKRLVLENKCFYNRAGHFIHRDLFLLQLLIKHDKENKAQLQNIWTDLEG